MSTWTKEKPTPGNQPEETLDTVTISECVARRDGEPVVVVKGKRGLRSVKPEWMQILGEDGP